MKRFLTKVASLVGHECAACKRRGAPRLWFICTADSWFCENN